MLLKKIRRRVVWTGLRHPAQLFQPKPFVFRLTRCEVERHSRAIDAIRRLFPVLACAILVGYFTTFRVPRVDTAFAAEFEQIGLLPEELHMAAPRYQGEGTQGAQFRLAAQSAMPDDEDSDLISLKNPIGYSEETGSNAYIQLVAPSGEFQRSTGELRLHDGVRVARKIAQGNYVITTREARFDLIGQTVSSEVGVTGVGDRGSVAAERMKTLPDGTVVFEGNVKMRLIPKADKSRSDKPPKSASDRLCRDKASGLRDDPGSRNASRASCDGIVP